MDVKRQFQVLRGNEEVKTGTVLENYTKLHLHAKDVVNLNGQPPFTLTRCLDLKNPKMELTHLVDENANSYDIYDRTDLSQFNHKKTKIRNTIFNECKIEDVSFMFSTLENVIFYRCYGINLPDFRHAKLKNVQFLYCKKIYGMKVENTHFDDVTYFKTELSLYDHTEYSVWHTEPNTFKLNSLGLIDPKTIENARLAFIEGRPKAKPRPKKPAKAKPEKSYTDYSDGESDISDEEMEAYLNGEYVSDDEIEAYLLGPLEDEESPDT